MLLIVFSCHGSLLLTASDSAGILFENWMLRMLLALQLFDSARGAAEAGVSTTVAAGGAAGQRPAGPRLSSIAFGPAQESMVVTRHGDVGAAIVRTADEPSSPLDALRLECVLFFMHSWYDLQSVIAADAARALHDSVSYVAQDSMVDQIQTLTHLFEDAVPHCLECVFPLRLPDQCGVLDPAAVRFLCGGRRGGGSGSDSGHVSAETSLRPADLGPPIVQYLACVGCRLLLSLMGDGGAADPLTRILQLASSGSSSICSWDCRPEDRFVGICHGPLLVILRALRISRPAILVELRPALPAAALPASSPAVQQQSRSPIPQLVSEQELQRTVLLADLDALSRNITRAFYPTKAAPPTLVPRPPSGPVPVPHRIMVPKPPPPRSDGASHGGSVAGGAFMRRRA